MERIVLGYIPDRVKKEEDKEEYRRILGAFTEMLELCKAGKHIYIEFLGGDREGSIARLVCDPDNKDVYGRPFPPIRAEVIEEYDRFYNGDRLRYHCNAMGTFRWDGRSNKVQAYVSPGRAFAYLRGYEGPTVWKKFDAKAAKEELLKNPGQADIDGNLLSVGDKVIYINTRYGYGSTLCYGTVKEFKATVDSKRHEIFTIIETKDGEESKVSGPENTVLKFDWN